MKKAIAATLMLLVVLFSQTLSGVITFPTKTPAFVRGRDKFIYSEILTQEKSREMLNLLRNYKLKRGKPEYLPELEEQLKALGYIK